MAIHTRGRLPAHAAGELRRKGPDRQQTLQPVSTPPEMRRLKRCRPPPRSDRRWRAGPGRKRKGQTATSVTNRGVLLADTGTVWQEGPHEGGWFKPSSAREIVMPKIPCQEVLLTEEFLRGAEAQASAWSSSVVRLCTRCWIFARIACRGREATPKRGSAAALLRRLLDLIGVGGQGKVLTAEPRSEVRSPGLRRPQRRC